MRYKEFPIVKEGFLFIVPFFLLTVIFAFFVPFYLTFFFALINLFLIFFFRNPKRTIPDHESAVVAPADGRIIYAQKWTEDQFLKRSVFKISIFMSVFNVHVNRIPVSGTIADTHYKKGRFFSANFDKASQLNERNVLLLETKDHKELLFIQIAGFVARRIVCWIKKGDSVIRGQRFGLICFGSRVDLFLPLETKIEVRVGQKVKGGETIMGYLE
ncbi:MAG: phosphatidylserine decarboxylase family protein [Thermodesulfobacteriota bacterium]|nr:phosphatidylserine decarboxylase family protein [Thermodesulfobacteriota bacterium]